MGWTGSNLLLPTSRCRTRSLGAIDDCTLVAQARNVDAEQRLDDRSTDSTGTSSFPHVTFSPSIPYLHFSSPSSLRFSYSLISRVYSPTADSRSFSESTAVQESWLSAAPKKPQSQLPSRCKHPQLGRGAECRYECVCSVGWDYGAACSWA